MVSGAAPPLRGRDEVPVNSALGNYDDACGACVVGIYDDIAVGVFGREVVEGHIPPGDRRSFDRGELRVPPHLSAVVVSAIFECRVLCAATERQILVEHRMQAVVLAGDDLCVDDRHRPGRHGCIVRHPVRAVRVPVAPDEELDVRVRCQEFQEVVPSTGVVPGDDVGSSDRAWPSGTLRTRGALGALRAGEPGRALRAGRAGWPLCASCAYGPIGAVGASRALRSLRAGRACGAISTVGPGCSLWP